MRRRPARPVRRNVSGQGGYTDVVIVNPSRGKSRSPARTGSAPGCRQQRGARRPWPARRRRRRRRTPVNSQMQGAAIRIRCERPGAPQIPNASLRSLSSSDPLCAETEHPSVQLLADSLLTIGSKRNSPALGPGFRSVAEGGVGASWIRANADSPFGRQPPVSAPTPDCCIVPAVRKSMNLDAGAAWAAVLLGEAKQQRQRRRRDVCSGPRGPALSKRAARAAAHQSNSDRKQRATRAPAQEEASGATPAADLRWPRFTDVRRRRLASGSSPLGQS